MRRISGFNNLVVWGRAVTNILQRLRGLDRERFDTWYEPFRVEMEADPLMRWFYEMRSVALKVGEGPELEATSSSDSDAVLEANPPPGTDSVRSGGELFVRLSDGTLVPARIAHSRLMFPDAPDRHLGSFIGKRPAMELGRMYWTYLDNLVNRARDEYADTLGW